MNYDEFKIAVLEELSAYIEDPKEISLHKIVKNNGLVLDGVVIVQDHVNIAPTIYLQPYFEEYAGGLPFDETCRRILDVYRMHRSYQNIDVSFFEDYSRVKKTIIYRLVHFDRNRELMADVPYVRFLDLAVIFYSLIEMDRDKGNASILIHNSHMDLWNSTTPELLEIAKINTPRLLKPQIRHLQDVIEDIAMEEQLVCPDGPGMVREGGAAIPMYLVSNQINYFGAGCILYDHLLSGFAEKMQSDFYILPSSVHEVILVPADNDADMEEMSEMVQDVNETSLLPQEILSDRAYYYSRKDNEIRMSEAPGLFDVNDPVCAAAAI